MGFERVIKRVAGDLPEVGVPTHQAAQPGVLQLLAAPQYRNLCCGCTDALTMTVHSRMHIEQCAVGIEDTSAGALQSIDIDPPF